MSNAQTLRPYDLDLATTTSERVEATKLESRLGHGGTPTASGTPTTTRARRPSWKDTWAFPAYSGLHEIV